MRSVVLNNLGSVAVWLLTLPLYNLGLLGCGLGCDLRLVLGEIRLVEFLLLRRRSWDVFVQKFLSFNLGLGSLFAMCGVLPRRVRVQVADVAKAVFCLESSLLQLSTSVW